MIRLALLGTGRIGKLHAEIINSHPSSKLHMFMILILNLQKRLQKNIIVK
jgi:predicted dehydrogenase